MIIYSGCIYSNPVRVQKRDRAKTGPCKNGTAHDHSENRTVLFAPIQTWSSIQSGDILVNIIPSLSPDPASFFPSVSKNTNNLGFIEFDYHLLEGFQPREGLNNTS